jgi:peptidoglycan LD-endopeptidase CwlK
MFQNRSLDDLVPAFRPLAFDLLDRCKARGVTMVAFSTLRTPAEQARLWASSRTAAQIEAAAEMLRQDGAEYLGLTLLTQRPLALSVKAESTRALPGDSWHQWGQAMDCYHDDTGAARWDGPGYDVYHDEAVKVGLTLISWERVHVQLPTSSAPTRSQSWHDIDAAMIARFGYGTPTA